MRDLARKNLGVYGWDRSPATVATARSEGFDVCEALDEALVRAEADDALIVLAVPMPGVSKVLDAVAVHAPHCGITDVVSVKQKVLREIQAHGMEDRYVGGHPMSGTSDSGWAASRPGLFTGAPWVVTFDNVPGEAEADRHGLDNLAAAPMNSVTAGTGSLSLYPTPPAGSAKRMPYRTESVRGPVSPTPPAASQTPIHDTTARDCWRRERWLDIWIRVVRMADAIGAEVVPARARTHDAAVARISHLPHVLAETLAVVGDTGGTLALSLAAGSFRDGTRVAGSAPALVQAMCENNVEDLVQALDEALVILQDARAQLTGPEATIEDLAIAGYRSRVRFDARSGKRPVIRLRPGAPGWVAQLAHAENLGGRIEIF